MVNGPVKVNGQTWKVNGLISKVKRWRQQLTQASDISNGATKVDVSNDVRESVEARGGMWKCLRACGSMWTEVAACVARDQRNNNFEQRMEAHVVSDGVKVSTSV